MNTALLTSDNPLRVSVVEIASEVASLSLPDKQTFEGSRKYLPKDVKEGDVLYLDLVSKNQLELSKKETAKAVLEEILG